MRLLTKSHFNRGLECVRRPWLDLFRKDLRPSISLSLQDRFDVGNALGELGRKRYANGYFISNPTHDGQSGADETRAAIDSGRDCLFEATFIGSDRLARVDILHRDGGTWTIDEVKSSSLKEPAKVGERRILDLAFQWQTVKDAGLDVRRARFLLVDSKYEWSGAEYDPHAMLGVLDLTEQCEGLQAKVLEHSSRLQSILSSEVEPEVELNVQCKDCDYFGHCHRESPRHDLIFLPQIQAKAVSKLRDKGYRSIADIPDDEPLTDARQRVRDVIVSGKPYIGEGLAAAVAAIPFPAAFIDYETSNPAFPMFPGTRPYQHICFQWSAHVLTDPDAQPVHHEFLRKEREDPRQAFCRTLWETIGQARSFVHYSSFEKTQLRSMAEAGIPYAAELLEAIGERSVDLEQIVKDHLYMEGFMGRSSIKVVLPTLVPELSYEGLAIQDGMGAAVGYRRMMDPATATDEAEQLYRDLLDYCNLDTLAMVEIYRALRRLPNAS